MRTIYLVRHAKSSWDDPSLRDFDRPLNERGKKTAPKMASLLAARGVKPDLLVSSPAKRAISTARYFAEAFGMNENAIVKEPGIYEAFPTEIIRLISGLPDAAQIVLLFGHNPTFTDVANRFTDQFIDNIPTCGIVCIESSAEAWNEMDEINSRVVARYFPKELL